MSSVCVCICWGLKGRFLAKAPWHSLKCSSSVAFLVGEKTQDQFVCARKKSNRSILRKIAASAKHKTCEKSEENISHTRNKSFPVKILKKHNLIVKLEETSAFTTTSHWTGLKHKKVIIGEGCLKIEMKLACLLTRLQPREWLQYFCHKTGKEVKNGISCCSSTRYGKKQLLYSRSTEVY